jgi:hypothetical protein
MKGAEMGSECSTNRKILIYTKMWLESFVDGENLENSEDNIKMHKQSLIAFLKMLVKLLFRTLKL